MVYERNHILKPNQQYYVPAILINCCPIKTHVNLSNRSRGRGGGGRGRGYGNM